MSVAGNQQRTLLLLLTQLRPHWRSDRNLPARIQNLLRRHRSFGSRDRRLYRELLYTTMRYLPWLEPRLDDQPEHAARLVAWLAADSAATAQFRKAMGDDWPDCPPGVAAKAALFNREPLLGLSGSHAPSPRPVQPTELLPSWIGQQCPEALTEPQLDALNRRAPLWLRAIPTTLPEIAVEFDRLGWKWQPSAVTPAALRMFDEVDVTKTEAFAQGKLEVQDLGSQLLLESVAVEPAGRWLDACAGAGGKTLQLAQLLGPHGRIDAFDVRSNALAELAVRANRAGLRQVSILQQPPDGEYDGVLVDAPCTGSGTWRRSPHLKWTITPPQIAAAALLQRDLLATFSRRVRPGGRLFYATCSLNHSENEEVVADFLSAHRDFTAERPHQSFGGLVKGGGLTLLPALHDTDGFFIAALRRTT